jgi:hypothetical protein
MPKHNFSLTAAALAKMLARRAEAVCQHYLPAGRREGHYWLVGDVHNTPGRSLFVRLEGGSTGKGTAGHWQDAAEGTHGDLLDLIRESCGLTEFRAVAEEARRFLGLENDEHVPAAYTAPQGHDGGEMQLLKPAKPNAPHCGYLTWPSHSRAPLLKPIWTVAA